MVFQNLKHEFLATKFTSDPMSLDKPNPVVIFTVSMKLLDNLGRMSLYSMAITWRPVLRFLAPLSHRGGRVERDTDSPGSNPREGRHLTDRREGKYIY